MSEKTINPKEEGSEEELEEYLQQKRREATKYGEQIES